MSGEARILKGVLIDVENERINLKPVLKHGYLVTDELKFEESGTEFRNFDYYFSRSFFNAHTHLADAVAKDPDFGDLADIVGPGGFKHRMLERTGVDTLRNAMRDEVEAARRKGTVNFLDFREGGLGGVDVVEGIDGVLVLGRPGSAEEAELIAERKNVVGFGMSSTRDHDFELLEEIRNVARRRNVLFAIHAGERDCDDVEDAISLEPDLIVHMNSCAEKLGKVIEMGIPVVTCPRSNAFFGLLHDMKSYEILSEYELWALGTDNAMIAKPCMLEEMHFLSYILRRDCEVFKAAVKGGEILNVPAIDGYVVFNRKWNFKNAKNPLSTLVRRTGCEDIEEVVIPSCSSCKRR